MPKPNIFSFWKQSLQWSARWEASAPVPGGGSRHGCPDPCQGAKPLPWAVESWARPCSLHLAVALAAALSHSTQLRAGGHRSSLPSHFLSPPPPERTLWRSAPARSLALTALLTATRGVFLRPQIRTSHASFSRGVVCQAVHSAGRADFVPRDLSSGAPHLPAGALEPACPCDVFVKGTDLILRNLATSSRAAGSQVGLCPSTRRRGLATQTLKSRKGGHHMAHSFPPRVCAG